MSSRHLHHLVALVFFGTVVACGPDKGGGGTPVNVDPGSGGRTTSGGAGGKRDAAAPAGGASGSGSGMAGAGGSDAASSDDGINNGGDGASGDASSGSFEDAVFGPIDAGDAPGTRPPVDADPLPVYSGTPRCYLQAIVRDFKSTAPMNHPDFEQSFSWGNDVCPGLVETDLKANGLYVSPVAIPLAASMTCPGISGSKPQFKQLVDWYQNTPGTNYVFDIQIPLYDTGRGTVAFDSKAFFPIDGRGWKDQLKAGIDGQLHNFGFTTHVLRHFSYRKGQTFTFTGDDDVWVFIEGKRVIDMGGLHPRRARTFNLDTFTPALVEGQTYRLDLFHAERKTDASSFGIETSICDILGESPVQPGAGDAGAPDASPASDAAAPVADAGTADGGGNGRTPACYMQAIVRDFRATGPMRHPDFEDRRGGPFDTCKGIVESALSLNGLYATPKPIADLTAAPCTTTNVRWPQIAQFGDWYTNKPGTNLVFDVQIPLYDTGRGTVEFDSDAFFPIDGRGFDDKIMGRDGKLHNYGFTTHVLRHFSYRKGQTFRFTGDDDVWVFVEGKLALDLGGLHTARTDMVKLDDIRPALVEGNTYRIDVFHAERRSVDSGFHIETSICDRFNP